MSTKKKTTKDADLRNDELLDGGTLDEGLRAAGLDVGGTPVERAERLEAHYLAAPPPVGWRGAWVLQCKVAAGGCGYHSTGDRPFCDFCGDGRDEAAAESTALAVVPQDGALEGEIVEEGEGLAQPEGELRGSVRDLDEAVGVVNRRLAELAEGERSLTGNAWDVGVAIFAIFTRNLHVARKRDGGAPLYASWSQFCKAEIGISSAKADRYMRIASCFTRELAQELGPSKLGELLPAAQRQAAEDARTARLGLPAVVLLPPLLERARVLPVTELRAEVKAAMPAAPPATGRAKGAEAAAKKRLAAKRPEAERVTVQRQEGTVRIRFFQDEEAARANDQKRLAKKFADGAVAVEPAVNGVECVYTLRLDAKSGYHLCRRVVRVG